ncbi:synapse differentiation-inducing gene protein 1-like [Carassius auratus]|uniref:Synapse differentiation-inducing gene protein 1-like n=1 Tax=Carassius auratus TaxID=7957 RepID=A0A6P6QEV8_CARAU|nr:synapse differentiation-inducing gene protein 1-like [Carassius auratus]XP_026130670.1 synapse differentiation-inducing gene protein 1-like [Carassius auratus]
MYQPAVPVFRPAVTVVQPTVPLVQSTVVMSQMPVAIVPDYLGYSIFTMLCCCLPLGIVAIIFSCNARDANFSGQRDLAMSHSRVAFILNNVSVGIGLAIMTMILIICLKYA